ncbi:MAG: hypothetical protein ABFD89_05155 [Bryobacteraceae bacterium]
MSRRLQVYRDAETGTLGIVWIDVATGDVLDKPAQILLSVSDLENAPESEGGHAKLRRVHYTDGSDGTKKRVYAMFTAAESDATSDGHDAGSDIHLGGGSGGAIMCQITNLYSANYIGVKRFDGTYQTGGVFYVAKSFPARLAESVTGYSYTYANDNQRTSVSVMDPTDTEEQFMTQPFGIGEIVFAIPVDHSGVFVGAVEVKWLEINTEREWTAPLPTPDPVLSST